MRRSSLFSLALAATLVFAAGPSHAQAPSDADRAAARQLYTEGSAQQKAGNYTAALDKFKRAQAVYPAPTNQLAIAECEVQLGHFVAGAETYRAITRLQLAADAPPAFVQAQKQAQEKLSEVEPRIAKLTVNVQPKDVQNLQVTIDGRPVNSALLGEPMPTDPGPHQIAASAPGYKSSDATATLTEKGSKSVDIVLYPTGEPIPVVAPGSTSNGSVPPAPPALQAPTDNGQPEDTSRGVMLGLHLGFTLPMGNLDGTQIGGADNKMSNLVGNGLAIGLQGGYRYKKLYLGAEYELSTFASGQDLSALNAAFGAGVNVSTKTISHYLGLNVGLVSNPDGVGVWLLGGVGYRIFHPSVHAEAAANSNAYLDWALSYTGIEGHLEAGATVSLSKAITLVPKVGVSLGSFTNGSSDCTSSGGVACPAALTTSGAIDNTALHELLFVGVGGIYNIPLH